MQARDRGCIFWTVSLAFAFQIAALADITQTTTLQSGSALNLDTGASVSSGGDLLWNGSTLTPQGKAKAYSIGTLGVNGFNAYTKAVIQPLLILASSAPLSPGVLVVNDLIAVSTNGGNVAKVLVTANSGGSITLEFTTYIATVAAGPTITVILNNSSRTPTGLPNSGIAPSSLFAITGSGLAAAGDATLHASDGAGLQTTLNGASLSVTVNGTTTHPAIYYSTPTQIDAVLPAATPTGTGTLTVTYNGASSSSPIQVVASAPGISTYNGLGVATDAITGALLAYTQAGTPGETIILWGTGLGADPADSDTTYTGTPHAINVSLQVYVGGVLATVVYQGASVYPGVDVIGLQIPANPPTGCWVPVAVVGGGVLGNTAAIPVSASGGACFDSLSGLTGNQIAPSGGQTLRTGLVDIGQTNALAKNGTVTVSSFTDAAFEKYTGIYTPTNSVSPGGCIVNDLTPVPVGDLAGLTPGTITLTEPGGSPVALGPQPVAGAYYLLLPAGAIPQTGGTYTFKGSGGTSGSGTDVGSFTSTVNFTNPLLVWTNRTDAVTVDRSQGLSVAWTGGNPQTYVFITGTSTSGTGSGAATAGFTCLANADDGRFTVPSYILSALPAGSGGILVQNDVYSSLSASGLDIGMAVGEIAYSTASTLK